MNELLLLLSLFTATVLGTVDTENESTETKKSIENKKTTTQTNKADVGIPKIVVF